MPARRRAPGRGGRCPEPWPFPLPQSAPPPPAREKTLSARRACRDEPRPAAALAGAKRPAAEALPFSSSRERTCAKRAPARGNRNPEGSSSPASTEPPIRHKPPGESRGRKTAAGVPRSPLGRLLFCPPEPSNPPPRRRGAPSRKTEAAPLQTPPGPIPGPPPGLAQGRTQLPPPLLHGAERKLAAPAALYWGRAGGLQEAEAAAAS